MKLLIAALVSFFFVGNAHASVVLNGVVVDPQSLVRGPLLTQALQAWNATPEAKRERIAIVDFALPSTTRRFHMVDLRTGAVESYLTAHGRGSDLGHDGIAESFSNEPGSNASSLGAYLSASRYMGAHGLSLRLKGLDATQNANAEPRAIVLHSAPYMDTDWRRAHGKPGRSFGCFVVETPLIEHVVTRLENGVLIFAGR
ncbi:MAG: murein L,D-transpeptidase catalytic domain family protein [Alphaproteobacteria bacterium]|nr:murein L,D-transpeptidase catalytic domain family protein [Alphaproteobacteria bacterium]